MIRSWLFSSLIFVASSVVRSVRTDTSWPNRVFRNTEYPESAAASSVTMVTVAALAVARDARTAATSVHSEVGRNMTGLLLPEFLASISY